MKTGWLCIVCVCVCGGGGGGGDRPFYNYLEGGMQVYYYLYFTAQRSFIK